MPNTEKELLLQISFKVSELHDKLHELEISGIESINNVNTTLTRQEGNLQEHMRRSELLEQQLEIINTEIKPVLQGLGFLKVIFKVVSFLGGVFYAWAKFKK